ncbi:SpoIIE family protein phosphatase, partial [Streptomyces sp. NPDC056061]|uniref:SpoIIE family protein phosphatase n=1 Tax=Streptomyces sp. NPDC056061 TaxID=3345700 RepID=UPI0035E00AE0
FPRGRHRLGSSHETHLTCCHLSPHLGGTSDRAVVDRLESPTTLPVGFGGDRPEVSERMLQPGDRLLCFTDGLIEEHQAGGEQFGEAQLIECTNRILRDHTAVRRVVRALSHALKQERGDITSDDATIFLIEWRGGDADHLATLD